MNTHLFVAVLATVLCAALAAPPLVGEIQPQAVVQLVDPPLVVPVRPEPSPIIINGVDVDPRGKYPWQVSLQLFGSHICGGSILNENTIITAAHCSDYPTSWYTVVVGLHRQSDKESEGVEIHRVAEIVVHESYMYGDGNYPNDIAVMHLRTPLTYGDYVQPITLDDQQVDDHDAGYDTEECVISGWGYTSTSPSYTSPDVLQETDTRILSVDTCIQYWGARNIARGHVCIMDGHSSACMGDSGGPLVCRRDADSPFRLVGVTSWGSGRCALNYPGVYTRVSQYYDWVHSKVV